jgi:hypothetical protein
MEGDRLYLHVLSNPLGKRGMPPDRSLRIPLPNGLLVEAVRWLNGDKPLPFSRDDEVLMIDLGSVSADPICTIIEVRVAK